MMKKLLKIGIMYVFAMLLTCFVLIGCALDKTPPDDDGTDTEPEAFTVTLNKNELTLEEGKTETISYVLSAQTDNIAFTSDNEDVILWADLRAKLPPFPQATPKSLFP